MNPAGHIFVVGLPLPSVSGQRFWVRNNIAVPAGRHWLPAVDSATVRRVFEKSPSGDFCSGGDQLPANDVNAGGADSADTLLWLDSGHWEMIPSDAFTAMTRAAVRASRAAAGQRQIDEGSSA
jgi:hypothetical protein